jgi:hypothetical protein
MLRGVVLCSSWTSRSWCFCADKIFIGDLALFLSVLDILIVNNLHFMALVMILRS